MGLGYNARGFAGCRAFGLFREHLREMLLGVETMLDAAAANVVLQIENIVERRNQIADIFRRSPFFVVQVNYPIQDLGRVIHIAERKPILMRTVVVDGSFGAIQLPLAPALRQRLAQESIENFDDRV